MWQKRGVRNFLNLNLYAKALRISMILEISTVISYQNCLYKMAVYFVSSNADSPPLATVPKYFRFSSASYKFKMFLISSSYSFLSNKPYFPVRSSQSNRISSNSQPVSSSAEIGLFLIFF